MEALLSDTYFCNLSIFQSMPDSWAIKQLFPIMPIHRLDEQPDPARASWATSPATRTARSTSSSTCATSATPWSCTRTTASPITSARSCSGAYQEILGDLHNLFGDTNAVHVSLDENGEIELNAVIKGDTVREVLHYVQYSADELIDSMRKDVERAVRAGKISLDDARQLLHFYESGMEGYTYME